MELTEKQKKAEIAFNEQVQKNIALRKEILTLIKGWNVGTAKMMLKSILDDIDNISTIN